MRIGKAAAFWPLLVATLVTDWVTKRWAEASLAPAGMIHPVIGDVLRFRLAWNRGAATGISLGAWSRPAFSLMAVAAVVIVARIYRQAHREDWRLGAACGLLVAGAIGNLLDRLRSPLGVVDFIDVGTGSWRFWTFNVADMGVTVGAVIIGLLLWRRDGLDSPAGVAPPAAERAP